MNLNQIETKFNGFKYELLRPLGDEQRLEVLKKLTDYLKAANRELFIIPC